CGAAEVASLLPHLDDALVLGSAVGEPVGGGLCLRTRLGRLELCGVCTGRRLVRGRGRLGARGACGNEVVGLERECAHLLAQRLESSRGARQPLALGLELLSRGGSSLEPPFEATALLRRLAPAGDLRRQPFCLAV